MNNKVIIQFINEGAKQNVELEIPINITANDLIIALNEAFNLEMDVDNIHEKSAPTSIPTEMNSSSRLKITLFDMSNSPFLIGIHFQSGRYTT